MRLKDLALLHKQVIHKCNASHTQRCIDTGKDSKCLVCKEDLWVKKYPYECLDAVCKDCFSDPDSFVEAKDLIDLEAVEK